RHRMLDDPLVKEWHAALEPCRHAHPIHALEQGYQVCLTFELEQTLDFVEASTLGIPEQPSARLQYAFRIVQTDQPSGFLDRHEGGIQRGRRSHVDGARLE